MGSPHRLDAGPLIDFVERAGRQPTGHDRWAVAWRRMRRTGAVTTSAADEFCVRVLGEHPAAVFGPEWSSAA